MTVFQMVLKLINNYYFGEKEATLAALELVFVKIQSCFLVEKTEHTQQGKRKQH